MATANFFSKTALSASQVLSRFDFDNFQSKLAESIIEIRIPKQTTHEAKVAAELSVNLLARLYPRLSIVGNDREGSELKTFAKTINPDIEFHSDSHQPTAVLNLGGDARCGSGVINIGSDGWIARASDKQRLTFGQSSNPFGAAAAACLGVAAVFRFVFADSLPVNEPIGDAAISLYDFAIDGENPSIDDVDLGSTLLVGGGAIGNAFGWTLSRVGSLSGSLAIIDHEEIELSNLQRYVLSSQQDAASQTPKVELLARGLKKHTRLTSEGFQSSWSEYLTSRKSWQFERVLIAVDSAEARCDVQASLPLQCINAWTGAHGDLGISRHLSFGDQPCIACLYLPEKKSANLDEVVAQALNLPQAVDGVRKLLTTGEPLSESAIANIEKANELNPGILADFIGSPLIAFYQKAVCGGLMLKLGALSGRNVEAPLAFQSALAGALLAAEVARGANKVISWPITRMNVLRQLPDVFSFAAARREDCICQDPDFVAVYRAKYRN